MSTEFEKDDSSETEVMPCSSGAGNDPVYCTLKRIFDIVVSIGGFVVLLPLLAAVGIAIKLEDGGSIIFKQIRLTQYGRPFVMYKFRSMSEGAENRLKEVLDRNEMRGPHFKIKDDSRITKIGRFIRRTSIDELPQLVNVLMGDMSIIGPRPPLPREVEQYNEHQLHRLDVKTGLGCYREVMGRNNIKDFNDWVELDLKYIRERSILTDLKIFFMMFKAVFTCEGAE